MPGLATITVVGLVVLAVLVVIYLRLRQQDMIGAMMDKRRGTAKVVSRAEHIEGAERVPVAISLTEDMFYYENPDLDASFELSRIDEIEYDDESLTGKSVEANNRVLRIRSHNTAFEFVLTKEEAAKWMAALPARTFGGQPAAAHAV